MFPFLGKLEKIVSFFLQLIPFGSQNAIGPQ